MDVIPGVKNVTIEEDGEFGRLSNGTVSILDCRTDVEIRPEQLIGVETLQSFSTRYRDWVRWVPPIVEKLNVNQIDEEALAACPNIVQLGLRNNKGHIVPRTVRELKLEFYTGAPIPPWIEKLTIEYPKAPIAGDLRNLVSILCSRGLCHFVEPPPAIRELTFRYTDVSGYVFPEGIVDLTLDHCTGVPVFPKSLKRLYVHHGNPHGKPEGVEVTVYRY